MKPRSVGCLARAVAVSLLLCALDASAAYVTNLTLLNPDNGNIPLTNAVLEWETKLPEQEYLDDYFGEVWDRDLAELTMTLYNESEVVFRDIIISGGAVQTIGGLIRKISWVFDLRSYSIFAFENDTGAQEFASDRGGMGHTGETFAFGMYSPSISVYRYIDGSHGGGTTFRNFTANTSQAQVSLPSPLSMLLLATPMLFGFRFGGLRNPRRYSVPGQVQSASLSINRFYQTAASVAR